MEKQGSNYMRELIRQLVRNLGLLEKESTSCGDVSISQCHAIVEVGRAGEISLNKLAEVLTLDKSTMSRTINNLVENNMVMREVHPDDRRYVAISLTDEGRKLFDDIEGSMQKYYSTVFNYIPENKKEQVLDSLQLLLEAINKNK